MPTTGNPTECGGMMITLPISGACAGDANPDFWFPEVPKGRPSIRKTKILVDQINYAIDICNGCINRDECLDEGTKQENIAFGIWGGLMAGERIRLTDMPEEGYTPQSDEGLALEFTVRMEPWVRW